MIAFDIFVCLAITYLITDYWFMNSIDDVYLIGRRIFLDQKKWIHADWIHAIGGPTLYDTQSKTGSLFSK